MFATGAAGNAEFATAMRKCFEDTIKFEEQERKAIAARPGLEVAEDSHLEPIFSRGNRHVHPDDVVGHAVGR